MVRKKFVWIEGKGWWFKDPSEYWLHIIPLAERLEKAVLDILRRRVEVTFDEILQEIYTKFTNALTPERFPLSEILQEYGEQVTVRAGRRTIHKWRLKRSVRAHIDMHSKIIKELANCGDKEMFDVWIGLNEQGKSVNAKYLRHYVSQKFSGGLLLPDIPSSITQEHIQYIDVLWIKENEIKCAFEVEYTTAITEAIRRLKAIPYEVKRVIVIPKERVRRMERRVRGLVELGMLREEELSSFYKLYFENVASVCCEGINNLLEPLSIGRNIKQQSTLDCFV